MEFEDTEDLRWFFIRKDEDLDGATTPRKTTLQADSARAVLTV